MASEYPSSPVEHPACQTRMYGHVRSNGTTCVRSDRKKPGSRNMALTLTARPRTNRSMQDGSCTILSSRRVIVSTFSACTRLWIRLRSDALA